MDPESIALQTRLNGQLMQDGNTRDHLWGVAETIAKLSEGTTLHAGTLISMGTPPGEGFKRDPQVFLKHGDVVTISGCEFRACCCPLLLLLGMQSEKARGGD